MMTEAFTLHTTLNQRPESPKPKRHNMPKCNSALNMNAKSDPFKRGSSFVVGQKLRESKWFNHAEINIFCAVVETGFVVQLNDADGQFGIAVWAQGFEKSKNPKELSIFTLQKIKGKMKVVALDLLDFWTSETNLRINNKSDKTDTPLTENNIRMQVIGSQYSKRKFHNTEHYTYFCRYGPLETTYRTKKISDHFRWNTESIFMKIKSLTIK